MTIEDKIKEIEEEIRKTPYNKATQHHIGKLKAKIARLKAEQEKSESGGKGGLGYGIKKSGDATIIISGFPSVGKSTLLNKLTNAESKVAGYEFTTLKVIPGALKYKGAELQLLDVPGLIEGASKGKGRGKEVLSVIRNADLLVIMIDAQKPEQLEKIKKELYDAGIRINQNPPDVKIKKTLTGGIHIQKTPKVKMGNDEIKAILEEFGIHNAEVLIRGKIDTDKLIDAVIGNRKYVPAIFVVNKTDIKNPNIPGTVSISAKEGIGIKELMEEIFKKLRFVRVYLKPQNRGPDFENPLILKEGSTIEDVCLRLHKEFKERFRYAVINGPSAAYKNQRVGLNHKVKDEDIVTIILGG